MLRRCCELEDSRLRRSRPDRASAVPYGQAGGKRNAFPPPCPQVGGCPQASQYATTTRDDFISGNDQTSSRLPAFSLFLPGSCPNNRDRRTHTTPPPDAAARRRAPPVLTYSVEQLQSFDAAFYSRARAELSKVAELTVPPRDAKAFEVPVGHFFRIVSIEGPQVGDLNLWNSHDLAERFYSGKTRALHATHLSTGDRLWSTFPSLRPMATITHDTLDWLWVGRRWRWGVRHHRDTM